MTENDMVCRKGLQQIGRVVCDTSDAADGSRRVIVEWLGGEESSVRVAELTKLTPVFLHRTKGETYI